MTIIVLAEGNRSELKYRIFANDHQPAHVHVLYKNRAKEARITFDGILLTNNGFSGREIRYFVSQILAHREDFQEAWDELKEIRKD